MEFVDGGSLYDYIGRTVQSSAYWKTTRQIMLDVAYGMSYLHGQHIVHADLKSPNILLRHNHSAVICDFGLARIMIDSRPVTTCYVSGTIKIEYEKNIVSFCLYRYGILVCTRTLF
jgi:serine/threonine protein kinase